MKTRLLVVLGALLAATLVHAADDPRGKPAGTSPGTPADERVIRDSIEAFEQAFQKGDAPAIAAMFAEDGEAVDADGTTIQGRRAIEEHYASRLASRPGDKIDTNVDSVAFLAPGVARVTGRTEVTPSEGGAPITGRFSAIEVKTGDRWLVASVHELPEVETGHYEHLKELEWLVGEWVEESEDAVVLTSVTWADNKNFLLRSFDVRVKGKPALSGTQRIGWDPLTRQIKSWVFDSSGGYGEGLWMRGGNHWVIKASGVRPDGRVATATQVLTYVNKDSMRWKSIDRTLGVEIAHDIDEVVMVRKPPQPK
jgi:uncharacterized protein (TIGR02246 family)